MTKNLHGTVFGNDIRFEEPIGLPDGVVVDVIIRPTTFSDAEKLEKLKSLFGSCREDAADLDAYMKQNAMERRLSRAEFPE